jgi:hypothetical protein
MLGFKPFEKNLFGQTRSWAAAVGGGHYIIEKATSGDTYQTRFQSTDGRVETVAGVDYALPSFQRARELCDSDNQRRLRQKLAVRARQPDARRR